MKIIAGDVGGTKTLLQCAELGGPNGPVVVTEERYVSEHFGSFSDLLRAFVRTFDGTASGACFAVAGAVMDDRTHLTNLKWDMDGRGLESEFGIGRIRLVNDFYAVAAGIPHLQDADLISINPGVRDRHGAIAILGAGTGLGEAFVIPLQPSGWQVVPSEGGHADFAPVTEEQEGLLRFLRIKFGRVSYERLLSGRGLVNILTFVRGDHPVLALPEDDQPEAVAVAAAGGDPEAVRAMGIFAEIYGAEAGNLALKVIARGGVYVAGGIAGKNLRWLQDGRFVSRYVDKGRLSALVRSIPVDVIGNAKVGLIGAAAIAASECASRAQ